MMYKRLLCALMAALLVLGGICAAEGALPLPEAAQTEEAAQTKEAPDDLAAAPVEAYPEELLSLDLDDAPDETVDKPAPADPEPAG